MYFNAEMRDVEALTQALGEREALAQQQREEEEEAAAEREKKSQDSKFWLEGSNLA